MKALNRRAHRSRCRPWPAPRRPPAPAPAKASSRRPPPAAPKGFQLPTPTRFTLPNGMKATLVQWGNTPKVDGRARHRGPATPTRRRSRSGWPTSPPPSCARARPRAAARRSRRRRRRWAAPSRSRWAPTPPRSRPTSSRSSRPRPCRLVADVARNPRSPRPELARLKADKLRELSIAKSTPQQIALEKFRAVLYPGHAYGRVFPSRVHALRATRWPRSATSTRSNFGAARAHLYVVGTLRRPRTVEKAIRERVRGLGRRAPLPRSRRRSRSPPAASTSWTGRTPCSPRSSWACPSSIPASPTTCPWW